VPEWLKGLDCKSSAIALNTGGSNPPLPTIFGGKLMKVLIIAVIVIFIVANWNWLKYMWNEYWKPHIKKILNW
jgi:hypothetical protein